MVTCCHCCCDLLHLPWLHVMVSMGTVAITRLCNNSQVEKLLNAHHLDEAILLAETIAAVEETRNPQKAEEV